MFAEQITAENFQLTLRGPDAIAGIGDWMLSNGTVCASISAPEHESYLSTGGGALIDLGYCGRADDQWSVLQDLANLSRRAVFGAQAVRAEVTAEAAAVIVEGGWQGLHRSTRYTLSAAAPAELAVHTTITRSAESEAISLFGTIVLHTHRGLTPFVLSTHAPEYSKGFVHPDFDTNDRSRMTEVLFPADLSVLIGPAEGAPGISYGLLSDALDFVDSEGERTPLRQFAIDDEDFSLLGVFTNPLWLDTAEKPGLLQLAQTGLMDLEVGESLEIRRRILLSPRADAAGITDRVYRGEVLRGRTDDPAHRIHVNDQRGHPLGFVQPQADGQFAMRLPEGVTRVQLSLAVPGGEPPKTVEVDAAQPVILASARAPATLELPAHGLPMRLVFKGREGTPDPLLDSDLRGFRVGGRELGAGVASNGVSLAGTGDDAREIRLPPGRYTVYATRGPEYTLERTSIELNAGTRAPLAIAAPRRALKSRHWIAADLHLHGEYSFDSTLPARRRVADFVAQGGEVLVATEHKRVVDYQPLVDAMGLRDVVVALTGTELTGMAFGTRLPSTIGHANVFPLVPRPQQFRDGGLPHEDLRLGEVIGAHKQDDATRIFQINHPRKVGDTLDEGHFFNHLAVGRPYDPAQSLTAETNRSLLEELPGSAYRDIDFDAIEIMNGSGMGNYRLLRDDWFSFLLQGKRHTATGNSDSHDAHTVAALPRNFVRTKGMRVDEEAVERFDREEFLAAIRRGRLFSSTGPLLDVRLGGKGLGATVSGRQADLSVRIHAADWVPVERLRVFVNGALVRESPASRHGTHEMSLDFARDSFVTVEIEGTPGGAYAAVYPGFTPFAFTNPIFVDADADGQWTAPGPGAKQP